MRFLCFMLLTCTAAASQEMRPEATKELDLAIELEHRGETREAERIILNVIRNAPSGSLESGVALNNLAVLYLATDRYADAERQFTRAMRVLKELPGELAQQVSAKTKLHLAALYIETGRAKEAAKLDPQGLVEVLRAPEDKVLAKGSVAGLAMIRKDLAAAERIYLEILSFWRDPSRSAKSQTEIATVLNNLGVIALWQGRPEVAQERLEESFAVWKSVLGPASPVLAKAMTNVATAYVQVKEYDEAAKWFARAAVLATSAFGELHPFTVRTQFAHAEALKKAGRTFEAREISRSASEAQRSMRSPSTADYTVDYRDFPSRRPDTRP
jgi:tetratricopeptide (TPR) repeat protein